MHVFDARVLISQEYQCIYIYVNCARKLHSIFDVILELSSLFNARMGAYTYISNSQETCYVW